MTNEKRSSFSGKIGFVLAAAGSAVGLGNIWRFPYLAAKYGGGIFLLVYILLALTFGYALMTAEIAIGRKTGLSAIGAYKKLDKRYSFIGWIGALVPIIILPYYSVIGGWVTKYLYEFVSGNGFDTASDVGAFVADGKISQLSYFENFIGTVPEGTQYAPGFGSVSAIEPVGWFLLFIGATALVVLCGVEKGIEKVSKLMMPVLVFLSIGLAVYVLTLDGAMDGVKYYLLPDFEQFSITTVLAAMGQLFYSMSLAMGIMITYGSYMKKDVNLESSVKQIEIFDTGIAFLAGLMIIPAVFSFSGGDPEALGKGPGLMFITLPKVFADIGVAGHVLGALFFVLVLFAALTSSISLMETVVSIVCDKTKINRKTSWLIVFLISIIIGLPSVFGYNIWSAVTIIGMPFLDFFDFISNSVIMPIVALFTCIFVGYVIKPKSIIEEVEISGKFKRKSLFTFVIKYFAPVCIVLILVSSVLDAFGIFKI